MPALAIETEHLGRIYKIRGSKKEKKIRKELVALADVNLKIEQGELFGIMVVFFILFGIFAVTTFRFCERIARERGLIDMVTNY